MGLGLGLGAVAALLGPYHKDLLHASKTTVCGFQQKLEKQEPREIGPISNPNSPDSLKNHLRIFTKDILRKILRVNFRISLYAIYCLYSVYIYDYIYY